MFGQARNFVAEGGALGVGGGFAGPARRHPGRLTRHFGIDGRPRRVEEPGVVVASVHGQQRLERLAVAVGHRGPRVAVAGERSGTVAMVSVSGSIASSSSQRNGVETCAPGRDRTDQAPKTVLCGAFWLKSTNTRWPRSSFHQAAVTRSGRRRSSSRATATAAERTS